MKGKKCLVIVLILLLAFSLFSCRKKQETTEYYRNFSSRPALTTAKKISLQGYRFDSFLNRGMILVSETQGSDKRYGVIGEQGELVLPVKYSSITMTGDFFLARGNLDETLYSVIDLKGDAILETNNYIEISDVGDGMVAVIEDSYATLYNEKGENVLPGSNFDYSYDFVSCGDFVLVKSAKRNSAFIFRTRTSENLLRFIGSEDTEYSVDYLGGNDFVVICNERVSAKTEGAVAFVKGSETTYYLQKVYRYTIGVEKPTRLETDRFLYSVGSRYSFGLTEEDREYYPLKEGVFSVRYYVTDGGKADGSLAYYIGNDSLSELGSLPEGVSPLVKMVDGLVAFGAPSGAIYFVNDALEVVKVIDDAQYQSVVWYGDAVIASKIGESGVRKFGGFDRAGGTILSFEYSYISAFVDGKTVVTKEGKAYLADGKGSFEYLAEESVPFAWDGYYEIREGSRAGLRSFGGVTLLSPSYDEVAGARRYGNRVFVAMSIADVTDIFVLS